MRNQALTRETWRPLGVMLLTALLALGAALATGRAHAQEDDAPLTPAELEELVGPIALYPDDVVAIVLPASTYPLEIVQAVRFLDDREQDASLEPSESWDDSVVALLNYPEVLRLLNDDLDWTWALGAAVLDDRAAVLDAVQTFRTRAYAAGNLQSDDKQVVTLSNNVIEVKPADPKVVYIPYYEPQSVVVRQPVPVFHYYPWGYPLYYYPYPVGYSFGAGFFWGVTTAFTIGWHTHLLNVYPYTYVGHPYYGYPYAFVGPYYYWRPGPRYGYNHDHVWHGAPQHYGPRPRHSDDYRQVRRAYEGYAHRTRPSGDAVRPGGSSIQRPGSGAQRQVGGVQRPGGNTQREVGGVERPSGSAHRQVGGVQRPNGGVQRQVGGGERPSGGTQRQVGGGERPSGGAQRQVGGGERPSGGAQRQVGGGERPSGGTQRQVGGGERPSGGTQRQVGGVQQPSGGTRPPGTIERNVGVSRGSGPANGRVAREPGGASRAPTGAVGRVGNSAGTIPSFTTRPTSPGPRSTGGSAPSLGQPSAPRTAPRSSAPPPSAPASGRPSGAAPAVRSAPAPRDNSGGSSGSNVRAPQGSGHQSSASRGGGQSAGARGATHR